MTDWDWRSAETEYRYAIELNPSHEGAHRLYGLLLAALSRSAEAIDETALACELDPLCVVANAGGVAWVNYLAGNYDTAIARCLDGLEMEPRYVPAHRILGAAYLAAGRAQDAIRVLEHVLSTVGRDPVLVASLAHAHGVAGHHAAARDLIEQLDELGTSRPVSSYYRALAHLGVGDVDAVFSALERAAVDRDPALTYVSVEPQFESVRSDARFPALLGRVGLAA